MPVARLSASRLRVILMLLGAFTGFAAVLLADLLWQGRTANGTLLPRCQPYFLIPREQVCGQRVMYTNPDGSRVSVGPLSAFAPMPKPPQEKR